MNPEKTARRLSVVAPDGIEIRGAAAGQGPALLLVYGAMMEQTGWARLLPYLLSRHRVYTYDRRGRGESGDAAAYTIEREVDDLLAFAAAVDQPFDVFAHSSGALLALDAAVRGLPARRLVLYEPPLVRAPRPEAPASLPVRIRALVEAGDSDAALAAFMIDGMGLTDEEVARLREGPRWQEQLRYARTSAYDVTIARGYVLRAEELSRLSQPSLLLMGEQSPAWMRDSVEAFAGALPHSRVAVIEAQAHNAQFGDPEQLAAVLMTGTLAGE